MFSPPVVLAPPDPQQSFQYGTSSPGCACPFSQDVASGCGFLAATVKPLIWQKHRGFLHRELLLLPRQLPPERDLSTSKSLDFPPTVTLVPSGLIQTRLSAAKSAITNLTSKIPSFRNPKSETGNPPEGWDSEGETGNPPEGWDSEGEIYNSFGAFRSRILWALILYYSSIQRPLSNNWYTNREGGCHVYRSIARPCHPL